VFIFTAVIRHDVQYSQNKTLNDRPSSVDFRGGDTYFGRSKIRSQILLFFAIDMKTFSLKYVFSLMKSFYAITVR